MRTIAIAFAAIASLVVSASHAQTPTGPVESFDLAFDVLVGPNVEVKILHEEAETFFEGPV